MADEVAGRSVQELVTGGWVSQVVRALAQLRVADHLADGPRSLTSLATATGTHAPSLARLMRAAVGLGLCTRSPGEQFALTTTGDALRSAAGGSARAFALMGEAPYQRRAWEALADAVRTGRPVFEETHGVTFWEYLAQHPDDQVNFDDTMAGGTASRNAAAQ
ncbi:MAG TPA: methyltransferase dimerization domain-containing protein [Nocardioidaceae bacterium]|nr:methyltransferase dimerization domain-containing protein [Nocardioidaceae bacterium]